MTVLDVTEKIDDLIVFMVVKKKEQIWYKNGGKLISILMSN